MCKLGHIKIVQIVRREAIVIRRRTVDVNVAAVRSIHKNIISAVTGKRRMIWVCAVVQNVFSAYKDVFAVRMLDERLCDFKQNVGCCVKHRELIVFDNVDDFADNESVDNIVDCSAY